MLSEYLLIGQVLRPQGIKGQVKVRPDTDDPDRFFDLRQVFVKRGNEYCAVPVAQVSVREDGVYLNLDGAETRDDAEKQRGLEIYIDRAHAAQLAENETFICDLIGCKALDRQGNELGVVTDVMQPGGNDVYVIKTPKGEMLIPALMFVVPQVNTAEGYIVVDESTLPQVAVCDWEN